MGQQLQAMEQSPEDFAQYQSRQARQNIANMLLQRGMQPIQGHQAGRFYVPPSWTQGLSQLAHAGLGAWMTNDIANEQQAMAQAVQARKEAERERLVAETEGKDVPAHTLPPPSPAQTIPAQGPPNITQGMQPTGQFGPITEVPPVSTAPMQGPVNEAQFLPPDPTIARRAITQAMLSGDPVMRDFAKLKLQQEQQSQEKEADREVRLQGIMENSKSRAAQLQGNMLMTQMQIDTKLRQGEDASELKKLLADQAAELKRDQLDTQMAIAKLQIGSKEKIAEMKGEKGKALPGSVGQKFMENSQNLRMAERALDLISGKTVEGMKGDPNATGMKGYLPDAILQRTDPAGVETRAAIANLGSMIIHDRSGAAVTASEYPRLRPFIPTVNDDPPTIRKKLNQFVMEYKKINEEMADFYKETGYTVPSTDWHRSPESGTGAMPTVKSDADYTALPSGTVFIGPDGKQRKKP
jgi:hypothetical protein